MAPDPSAIGFGYTSTRLITDSDVLTVICDKYDDACDFFNTVNDGATGKLLYNSTASTYIKKSIGQVVNGSTQSYRYLKLNPGRNIWCIPYVGWNLPADNVKHQCDSDTKCDGFVMKMDNSFGQLCNFVDSEVGNRQPYIKLRQY